MKKKPLIAMFMLFLLPIIIAKLVLINGWYSGAETNAGKLISPTIKIDESPNVWVMLFNPPAKCQKICQQSLWQIQQIHTLLSSEGPRVQPYLTHDRATKSYPTIKVSQALDTKLTTNTLYLVDPQGNLFMQYQFPANKEEAISISAGVLKDVKRLLKISKIG